MRKSKLEENFNVIIVKLVILQNLGGIYDN